MTAVGCLFGFLVSALANIILRAGPPKLRYLTFGVWPACCCFAYYWLLRSGGDPWRSAAMAAIAIVSGVIVGPIYADLIVGTWFYKRGKRKRDAELAIKLAAIKAEGERRQEEIRAAKGNHMLIYWWRFRHALTADPDFIPDMLNAAVWFSVNLTCVVLTGGLGLLINPLAPVMTPIVTITHAWLNMGGFIFDYFNEVYKGVREYVEHKLTLYAVDKEILELRKKPETKENRTQIALREWMKERLEQKINHIVIERTYNVFTSLGIVGGMVFAYFSHGKALIAGGYTALVAGSGLGGFGKRLFLALTAGIGYLFKPPVEEQQLALQESRATDYMTEYKLAKRDKQREVQPTVLPSDYEGEVSNNQDSHTPLLNNRGFH